MKKACIVPQTYTKSKAPDASCPIWVQRVRIIPFAEKKIGPVFRFRCGENLHSARFVMRDDPTRFRVLHGSTKRIGGWQMSSFDDRGAVGDTNGVRCDDVMNETRPLHWRLVKARSR